MRTVLTINGFDIVPYLAEGGIDYAAIKRVSRSVVTLDGKDHRSSVTKTSLSLKLLDMSNDQLATIDAYITDKATISYTDRRGVLYTDVQFYVDPPKVTAKRTIGNITYLSGISLTLEEV